MNSGAIAVGHRGGVPLPSPVLFLSLLLSAVKFQLLFRVPLFAGARFPFQLLLLPLQLQCLLRLCPHAATGGSPSDLPLHTLRICRILPDSRCDSRTESEPRVIFQHIRKHVIVLRFCAEGDLADRERPALEPLEHPDPDGASKNTVSLVRSLSITKPS